MTAKEQGLPEGLGYTVERHGNGWAIYRGRDHEHHGWNLGHLTECSPELVAQISAGLNALASDTGERGVVESFSDKDIQRQQANAWMAVCGALDKTSPDWRSLTHRGVDSAVAAIAALRAQPAGGGERKPNHRWLPTDVLGNPMREYAPGKWESATWPSDAPPESGGQGEKGRWFCDGPNGYFYSDDADAARKALNIIDPDGDDWTMTDTLTPFGPALTQGGGNGR